jgi:hypothetical protein
MDGKAGTQWVSKVGVANDPKTLIIGDSSMRPAAANSELAALHDDEQMVAIWDGKLEHVRPFFKLRPHTFRNVETIVLLGYGMEDLCTTDLHGVQQQGLSKEEFLMEYIALINHIHDVYPDAQIISSDPLPRRTEGFGNARMAYFSRTITPCFPSHHHISLAKSFFMRKNRALREEKYEADGIRVKEAQIKVLTNAVHETMAKIKQAPVGDGNNYLSEMGISIKF